MIHLLPAAIAGGLAAAYLDAKYYIREDVGKIRRGIQARKGLALALQTYRGKCCVYDALHRTKGVCDKKVAFIFEDRQWTFQEVRVEVERLEQELRRIGIRNRDYVAVLMNNSPEFFFTFWALAKIGAIPATINTSLAKDRLLHCVDIPKPKLILTTYELYPTLLEATRNSPYARKLVCYDHDTYAYQPNNSPLILHWNLQSAKTEGNDWSSPPIDESDPGMLLYTSGTTGLPKASIMPAFFLLACSFPNPLITPQDRVYCPLPLFHGTAVLIGMVSTYSHSATVIISRKFSNTTFWPEVRATKATVVIYIGEMIRYLCQAPATALDAQNDVRAFWGLGLQSRANWLALRHRFGVPTVIEYYGATEGTSTQYNINSNDAYGVGMCGHRGPLLRALDKRFVLVRHDATTGEIVRTKDGLCEETAPGEPGESLTLIDSVIRSHDYFNNRAASHAKIVRNVLRHGDAYVRIGDILQYDRDGFLRFVDRLGDTYRVKGHNISTTEVEVCLAKHPDIVAATCYAVTVGDNLRVGARTLTVQHYGHQKNGGSQEHHQEEGRQQGREVRREGMAAIVPRAGADTETLLRNLERILVRDMGLPPYAVPKYICIVPRLHTTATHKIDKSSLKKQGVTGASGGDGAGQVYTVVREGQGYVPFVVLSPRTAKL